MFRRKVFLVARLKRKKSFAQLSCKANCANLKPFTWRMNEKFFRHFCRFYFRVQKALSLFHIITFYYDFFSCTQQHKNEREFYLDNRGKKRLMEKERRKYIESQFKYLYCVYIKTWFIKRHDQPLWGRAFFICFGCTLARRISSCKFAVVFISIVFNDTIFHADFHSPFLHVVFYFPCSLYSSFTFDAGSIL